MTRGIAAVPTGAKRGGPMARRSFKTTVVPMADVPELSSRSVYTDLFEQLYKLGGDKATKIEFESESQATGARASLRKQAEKCGCKFRANRGHDGGFVWYCWIDRVENR